MIAVVIELKPIVSLAAKDPFVYGFDLILTTGDPTHGVVYKGAIRWRPILRHHFQVLAVKGLIELRKCPHL